MRKALRYSKKLEGVGLPRNQTEAHVEILEEIIEQDMATKSDLMEVERRLDIRLGSLETKFESEIQKLEYKLTTKLGFMITAALGAIATFFKFIL